MRDDSRDRRERERSRDRGDARGGRGRDGERSPRRRADSPRRRGSPDRSPDRARRDDARRGPLADARADRGRERGDGARSRSRSRSPRDRDRPRRDRKRRRSADSRSRSSAGSGSEGSSSGSSRSSSEDSQERRRRRKKEKERRREKEEKRRKKKDKERRKHKKEKERSKDKDKPAKAPLGFGARGILRSSDIYSKDAEFRAWLIEVKNIDPGILKPSDYKTYFGEYMEDYNTCTLPHDKYYDLDTWEKKTGISQKTGLMPNPAAPGEVNLGRDEEQLKKSLRAGRPMVPQVEISQDQIMEVKQAWQERIAADRLSKQGFKPSSQLGVRYESTKQGKAWNAVT